MDTILDQGVALILYLQSLADWLVPLMQFFSFLGTEEFFLIVAPALFWCYDAALGIRVGSFLMLSGVLNYVVKIGLHDPRPYWYDTRVKALSVETSFGIPSGHAEHAVTVWGAIAASLRKRWAWIAAVTLIFFIGLSRLFLGMHFPSDVLAGWLLGAAGLWLFLKLEGPVIVWLKKMSPGKQILVVFAGTIGLFLLGLLAKISLGAWTVPADWIQNAINATGVSEPIDPLALSGLVSNVGTLFGLAAGAILLPIYGGFDAGGPAWKRGVRFAIGLVGVLLLWRGLGAVLPRGEDMVSYALRYMRYALIGFWITGLSPLLFTRLGLAERSQTQSYQKVQPAN